MPTLAIASALAKVTELTEITLFFCIVAVQGFGLLALVKLPKSKCNFKA